MLNDTDLWTFLIWTEARGESFEGKLAVAEVVKHRMAEKYQSDGTIAGTAYALNQFSAFYFDMVNGKYTRVRHLESEAEAWAEKAAVAARQTASWGDCAQAAVEAQSGNFSIVPGPNLQAIIATPRCLLYCNLSVSHPAWAVPSKMVGMVGHHTFFRD